MPQQRYRIRDSKTGRSYDITWNGNAPPTERDIDEMIASQTSQSTETITQPYGGGWSGGRVPRNPLTDIFGTAAPSASITQPTPSFTTPPPASIPAEPARPSFLGRLGEGAAGLGQFGITALAAGMGNQQAMFQLNQGMAEPFAEAAQNVSSRFPEIAGEYLASGTTANLGRALLPPAARFFGYNPEQLEQDISAGNYGAALGGAVIPTALLGLSGYHAYQARQAAGRPQVLPPEAGFQSRYPQTPRGPNIVWPEEPQYLDTQFPPNRKLLPEAPWLSESAAPIGPDRSMIPEQTGTGIAPPRFYQGIAGTADANVTYPGGLVDPRTGIRADIGPELAAGRFRDLGTPEVPKIVPWVTPRGGPAVTGPPPGSTNALLTVDPKSDVVLPEVATPDIEPQLSRRLPEVSRPRLDTDRFIEDRLRGMTSVDEAQESLARYSEEVKLAKTPDEANRATFLRDLAANKYKELSGGSTEPLAADIRPRGIDKEKLAKQIAELESTNAPDYRYQQLLPIRTALEGSKTWRDRALKAVNIGEQVAKEEAPLEDFTQKTIGDQIFINHPIFGKRDIGPFSSPGEVKLWSRQFQSTPEFKAYQERTSRTDKPEVKAAEPKAPKLPAVKEPERPFRGLPEVVRDVKPKMGDPGTPTRWKYMAWEYGQSAKKAEAAGRPAEVDFFRKKEAEALKTAEEMSTRTGLPAVKSPEDFSAARTEGGKLKIGSNVRRSAEELTTGYKAQREAIMVREGLQNAFDAVKKLPSGSRKVGIKLHEKGIEISDNGNGMDPDELYTVYSDIHESGKVNEEGAAGGKGVGKVVYMLGGSHFEVETVKQMPNGTKLKSSFSGTPEELLDTGVNVKSVKVPNNTPTGTRFMTQFKGDQSRYHATDMIDNIVKYNRKFNVDLDIDTSPEMAEYRTETQPHGLVKHKLVDTSDDTLGARGEFNNGKNKVEVYIPKDVEKVDRSFIRLRMLNKGMYQYDDIYWLSEQAKGIPAELLVNVDSSIPEGKDDYPFGVQRESVQDSLKTGIDKLIKDSIVAPIGNRRSTDLKALWDGMSGKKSDKTGIEVVLFDSGNRLTTAESMAFSASPTIQALVNEFDRTVNEILVSTGRQKWQDKVTRVGMVLNDTIHGIHIPNPYKLGRESAILINNWHHVADNNPKEAAFLTVVTMLHEAGHVGEESINVPSPMRLADLEDPRVGSYLQAYIKENSIHGGLDLGHATDFSRRLAEVFNTYGTKAAYEAAARLEKIFTDPNTGGYRPEIQRFLRVYKESRGRNPTKEDIISGTGVKQTNQTGGPAQTPPSNPQTGGIGPPTGGGGGGQGNVINQPRPIKDLYQEWVKERQSTKLYTNQAQAKADRQAANKKFVRESIASGHMMEERRGQRVPQDWKSIDPDALRGPTGGLLRAPKPVRKLVNNYISEQSGAGRLVADVAGKIKAIALSSGVPKVPLLTSHGLNMVRAAWGDSGVQGVKDAIKFGINPKAGKRLIDRERQDIIDFTKRNGEILGVEDPQHRAGPLFSANNALTKVPNAVVELQQRFFERPLFEEMIPALKWQSVKRTRDANISRGVPFAQAEKHAADSVNDSFGGINYDLIGRNKNYQNLLRILFLAPDWLESRLNMGKGIYKDIKAKLGGNTSNLRTNPKYLKAAGKVLAAYVAADVLQKILTGDYMHDNDGNRKFAIKFGKTANGKDRYIDVFGTAYEWLKAPVTAFSSAKEGQGPLKSTKDVGESKFGFIPRVILNTLEGEDYMGRPNVFGDNDVYHQDSDWMNKVGNSVMEFNQLLPAYMRSAIEYGTGRQGAEESIMGAAEMPVRYSTPKKDKPLIRLPKVAPPRFR